MKRSTPRRRTPLARRAWRVSAVSARTPRPRGKTTGTRSAGRSGALSESECRAIVAARSRGTCETCPTGQPRPATDMAHRRIRRVTAWCPCSILHQCRDCHQRAHAHPAEATSLGVMVSQWSDPRRTPARLTRGWVWLHCDGSTSPQLDGTQAGAGVECAAGNHAAHRAN